MDNEFTFDDALITLNLDDGSQMICEVMAFFFAGDYEYVALAPHDDPDGDALVYRYAEDEEGNPLLSNIETDEEYELVAEAYDELQDELAYEELIEDGELEEIEFEE